MKDKFFEVRIPVTEMWVFHVEATNKKQALWKARNNHEDSVQIHSLACASDAKELAIEIPKKDSLIGE